jgi:hypothetical protein
VSSDKKSTIGKVGDEISLSIYRKRWNLIPKNNLKLVMSGIYHKLIGM